MTGLEKIIKEIKAKAKADAEQIILEATKEADEIYEAAKIEAANKEAEIAEKSEKEIKSVLSRAESAAKLQKKKILLDGKQNIINDIIDKAKDKLLNLSDSDYFDVTLKMIKKHAQNQQGEILFSERDKKRIPKDYMYDVEKALSELPKASLTVADETADISGGFILVYGDIEENCSFDALFSASRDDLQDKVNSLLFG